MSELPQDAQVVLPEHPDVRDAEALRRDAVEPEAPGEATPLVRVVPDVLEHRRIDDARAAHLVPARVLAERAAPAFAEEARHVELDRRLREGKEVRPHAELAVLAE